MAQTLAPVRVTVAPPPLPATPAKAEREVDVKGLSRGLRRGTDAEVRFDSGSRAMYATDASNFRQVPIGVVIPRSLDDVVAAHRLCHEFGAPILNRGGGTSLSGETVNFAVVIDHSKYLTNIVNLDVDRRLVTVQNGIINEQLNRQIGRHGFIFGPDPSSHSRCTIGGNVGNNSCGVHSVQSQFYGPGPRTSDNVHSLDVVTYDGSRFSIGNDEERQIDRIIASGGRKGEIYGRLRQLRNRYADLIRAKYPPVEKLPRRISGYNLDELLPEKGFNVARALVGTESTCASVLQATLILTPAMLARTTVVIAFDDIVDAGNEVPDIMAWKPIGLEAIDHILWQDQQQEHIHPHDLEKLPRPGAGGWLLVQFGADTPRESEERGREFSEWLTGRKGFDEDSVHVYPGAHHEAEALWRVREGGLGATAFPPDGGDHWPGWEDSAVPPERVGAYVRDLRLLYQKHGLRGAFYGHFGQGCVHSRISFELRTAEGLKNYRSFMEEAADLVVSYGGSLSGEHGDGQQRAELLVKQYGPELLQAMREFKSIWDPDWKMNPGKVVSPYRLDENLKLGEGYNPWRPSVKFSYPEDKGDFAHAALRCVGVGVCRVPESGMVMCPSYKITREEKHSTRGRARLFFEMLEGDVIQSGWASEEVHEALDLCLACKGCTSDCPVHVDMPTYKAEFLYHHYRSPMRRRPRHAYAFGFIDQVARLAARSPEAVNFLTRRQPFATAAKLLAGMSQQRDVPAFAPMTLQEWFRRRGGSHVAQGPRVVLWPDTFNNYFHTQVGVACVEALEAAGWRVSMPQSHVCCGRPLYDYGFLNVAQRYLKGVLDAVRDDVRSGTPIVGMEPSCVAVFKHELPRMLPHDDDARRLTQNIYHWSEFFQKFDVRVPALDGQALLWGHCHHKATGGMEQERQLLERMGLQVEEASGGCCGLAGSWGFEAGHHEISMACGEEGLLPAVRQASGDTVIIANGFSCKTQIAQAGIHRSALHVAEVMKLAREAPVGQDGLKPEEYVSQRKPAPSVGKRAFRTGVAAGVGVATLLAGAAAASGLLRRLTGSAA